MNNIKKLREGMGLTSKELSERTGIPYDSLKNYEYGRREPSGPALVSLEKFFHCSGEYILGQSDVPRGSLPAFHDVFEDVAWSKLFSEIISCINSDIPFSRKEVFELLIEILSIMKSDNLCETERNKSFSLLNALVSNINLIIDKSSNPVTGVYSHERLEKFKNNRLYEYRQYIEEFLSDS